MRQERAHKPMRKPAGRRAEQDRTDAERGRQEVREDIAKTWWPEGH